VLAWAGTGALGGEAPRFTACLSNGRLSSIAVGDSPLVPCKDMADEVTWASEGLPGLPGEPGSPGQPGADGTDGPGRVPGEQLLNLADWGPDSGWSCSSDPCEVFGPGPIEGALSLGCETVSMTLDPLPAHTKVRIQATVGFVDDWQGETVYLSVGTSDEQDIVWTQYRDARLDRTGINLVNGPIPDLPGQPVDVIVDHSAEPLTITFGTTLPCGAAASAAVDALSVSIAP
jgi:hypothetical protein